MRELNTSKPNIGARPLMTQKLAIIDPFVESPALMAANRLVDTLGLNCQYHQPSFDGITTLEAARADGYIVLGSASHVFQNLPWHKPLADFLLACLQEGKPVFGICFGHQLIAHAFGSKISFVHPDETKITGVRQIALKQDAYGFKSGDRLTLKVRHRQAITELSPVLEEIGMGIDPVLPFDFIRHKTLPFFGVQAHPEEWIETEPLSRTDGERLIKAFFRHQGFAC